MEWIRITQVQMQILSHSSITKVGELLGASDFSCLKSKKLIVLEESVVCGTQDTVHSGELLVLRPCLSLPFLFWLLKWSLWWGWCSVGRPRGPRDLLGTDEMVLQPCR